jgi:mRNA interferase MazF
VIRPFHTSLAAMPGNVFVPAAVSGLPKDSVVNITALVTLNQTDLEEPTGQLPESLMEELTAGYVPGRVSDVAS